MCREQVWERATWNDEDGEWLLPAIKPRPGFSQIVKLPGIGRGCVFLVLSSSPMFSLLIRPSSYPSHVLT